LNSSPEPLLRIATATGEAMQARGIDGGWSAGYGRSF
jgi:hypothetical protein